LEDATTAQALVLREVVLAFKKMGQVRQGSVPRNSFGKLPRRARNKFELIRYRIDGPGPRLHAPRPEHIY